MRASLSWLEHTTDNREVDGSSPFVRTIYLLLDAKQKINYYKKNINWIFAIPFIKIQSIMFIKIQYKYIKLSISKYS